MRRNEEIGLILRNKKPTCYDSNCQECSNQRLCEECKSGFALVKGNCYYTQCSIYGQCDYCTEYDCIQCQPRFKLSYGFCEATKDYIRLEVLFGVLLPLSIVIILSLMIIFIRRKRLRIQSKKVISADILSKKRPPPGQYIIINTTNITNSGVLNINNTQASESNLTVRQEDNSNTNTSKLSVGECIFCRDKSIFSFTACGCGLCKKHYKESKGELVYCPNHQSPIVESLVIKKGRKELRVERLDNSSQCKMCYVCKIHQGTMSFNCGCPILLCSNCFNHNVFVFKFQRCPGCNEPYKGV